MEAMEAEGEAAMELWKQWKLGGEAAMAAMELRELWRRGSYGAMEAGKG